MGYRMMLSSSEDALENTDGGLSRPTSIPLGAQNASLERPFENTRFLANESSFYQRYLADYLKI
jgi:hypothetical protein